MKSRTRSGWSRFLLIAKPFFQSSAGRWGIGLFSVLLLLVLFVKGLDIRNSYVYGDLITSATERKADRVCHLALLYAGVFAISALVATLLRFTEEILGLRWRGWLTRHLTDRYLANRSYHRIKITGQLDNPDQRISEDVKTFTTNTLSIVLILVNATVALAGFAGVLWSITPWLLVGAVGYAAFGTIMTVLLGRRLVGLDVQQFKKEADFRYELIRVREHADPIALLRGEHKENGRVCNRLQKALENFRSIIGVNRNLGFFTSWYGYMTQLIPVLITVPLYMQNKIEFGQVAQAQVGFNFVLDAFSLIVKEFQRITTFAAVVERLGAFYEATEDLPASAKSPLEVVEDETRVAFEGLTLATPDDGRLLIENLSLDVPRGKRLLISGPDGSGRTALMRAMSGLWKEGQGRILRPPLEQMMFLPQQPYLTLGSLRDQLLYTLADDEVIGDERLLAVLRDVQLESVLERVGGLDTPQREWTSILSLGEQQSLAFARLLLVEPDFAFLDEATSALPAARIHNLFKLLSRTSTTYLSVGSKDLLEYHDMQLQLRGDGTWLVAGDRTEESDTEWASAPLPALQVG
ncbi:MAG TPA: ATP-binding cassette domain-containing protein [Gemmataceae bacterium]|nr:ATP-binding cassette domain-containing protein [Gemmataceae bacterium]